MRYFYLILGLTALLLPGLASAYWQSRDSNYGISVSSSGGAVYQSAQSGEGHDYSGTTYTSASPYSITIGTPAASGAEVNVCVYFTLPSGLYAGYVGTLTDGKGNSYTESVLAPATSGGSEGQLFETVNVSGGPTVYTFTPNVAVLYVQYIQMFVGTFTGISSAATLDGHAGQIQFAPGDTVTSGNFTESSSGDLTWGCTQNQNLETPSHGTGYTLGVAAQSGLSEYKIGSTSGTNAVTAATTPGTNTMTTIGHGITVP